MPSSAPLVSALSILGAMFVIGFIDSFVVEIAGTHGLWQFHAIRALMALPLILALALAMGWRFRPQSIRAVALRSVLIATAILLYFGALAFLSVAEAAAGLFTSPIFVLLISVFALGEKVGPARTLAAVAGFAGVLLVLRPEADVPGLVVAVPVLAGFFYALGAIATRRLCANESSATLLLGFFLVIGTYGALGALALSVWPQPAIAGTDGFILRGWQPATGTFLFWTFVQAAGSVLAVALIIKGYQSAEASFAASFEYALLIFAALWGWILWGETVGTLALAGFVLIIASGVVLALRGR